MGPTCHTAPSIVLDDTAAEDPSVAQFMMEKYSIVRSELDRVRGYIDGLDGPQTRLSRSSVPCGAHQMVPPEVNLSRGDLRSCAAVEAECRLGNMIADAFRHVGDASGLLNNGAIKGDLENVNVTDLDLIQTLPF